MIDAAKIEELRGLDAAATPGPWKWDGDVCDGSQDYRDQNAPWLVTDDLLEVPILRGDITGSRDADAALIVAMRNALPELLDLAASLASAGEDGLCKALTSYQQADEDGVMVLVSRQACDEAATRIRALASEKEGLRRERDEAIATSKRNWDDCGKMHNALGRALQIVCLSEELCYAVDAEAEDIGTGKRNSLRILQEIGPLVEKARKQAEEAFNGWPRF